LTSPTVFSREPSLARRALHIVSTNVVQDNEILVRFSDGSGALYEAEELEKLRPTPKQIFPPPSPNGGSRAGLAEVA
jgi:hypothetical protein